MIDLNKTADIQIYLENLQLKIYQTEGTIGSYF
jgi:hypothetical protein